MIKRIEKTVDNRTFVGEVVTEIKRLTKGSKYFNPVGIQAENNYIVTGFVDNIAICAYSTPSEEAFLDLVEVSIRVVEKEIEKRIKNLEFESLELKLKDLGFENTQILEDGGDNFEAEDISGS